MIEKYVYGRCKKFLEKNGNPNKANMLIIGVQVSECDSFCFIPIFSVASICYAHLAASQLGQWMKFEDTSEISSSHGEVSHAGFVPCFRVRRDLLSIISVYFSLFNTKLCSFI